MNSAVQVCTDCNASLALGLRLHFCPYCGTVQIERKVLASKTTEHYDPSNPQHKPWRDDPHLPKRNYTYGDPKKKQPWCPAMRQPRRRTKAYKSKMPTADHGGVHSEDASGKCEIQGTVQTDENGAQADDKADASDPVASEQELTPPPESFTECEYNKTV
jgi:predicted RNA-binding Zn-ribbon protein involved in translation (DUF1610 family)